MIRLQGFKGRLPKVHRASLPPGYAQVATACELVGGVLRAHNAPVQRAAVTGGSEFMAFIEDQWRGFPDANAHVATGPVATDRVYVTCASDVPRVRRFTGTTFNRELRLLRPQVAPTLAEVGSNYNPNDFETVVFALTYVTDLGEESRPSDLSAARRFSAAMTLTVTAQDTVPAGRGITERRVYRSLTDFAGNVTLHYVGAMGIGAGASFTYTLTGDPLQEPIASTDYDTPRDAMQGLTAMANGMMAGFTGTTLCFCEPYIPHAWPRKYELTTDAPIVGLVAFGQTLAVLTKGAPHLVSGSHPSTLTSQRWEEVLPCLSPGSIVDTGNGGIYASTEGLVAIGPEGPRLITRGLFDFAIWRSLKPSTIRSAVIHDGRYKFICDPDDGLPNGGFIDLTGEEPYYLAENIDAAQLVVGLQTGKLFFLADDNDGPNRNIYEFDADGLPDVPYTWTSGILNLPYAHSFGWAYLDCDPGDSTTTVTLLAGPNADQPIASFSAERTPVRLPGGRLDQQFAIRIEGTATVRSVTFGDAPEELLG